MKEALGPTSLANLIRMIRSETDEPILIVEGEEDKFVVEPHLHSRVRILPGNIGKNAILRVATELQMKRLFFLLDRDLDDALPVHTEIPDYVVRSGSHDIIMDLVSADSSYLERALRALTRKSRSLIDGRPVPNPQVLAENSFELAWSLVPVRIANQRSRFEIKLRDFPYGALTTVEPSLEEVARTALHKRSKDVSLRTLLEAVERERVIALELGRALVGDHDFFGAASRVLIERGVKRVTREQVETAFLATVDCALIAKAKWAKQLDSLMREHGVQAFSCPHPEQQFNAA